MSTDLSRMQELLNRLIDNPDEAQDTIATVSTLIDSLGGEPPSQLRLAIAMAVMATAVANDTTPNEILGDYPQAAKDVVAYFTAQHHFATGRANIVH